MSFQSPIWLAALAVIPVALAAYLWSRRRKQRYAVRFTALPSLRTAAAEMRSPSSHIPAALLLAAIALLAVAMARPRINHRVAVSQASMMLVIDHSGSMAADDVQPTRIAAAQAAANTFIGQLPSSVRVGAIGFGTVPDTVQQPVSDHGAARALIESQTANGGTDTGDALALALRLLHATDRRHPPSAIVLLSDGAQNAGPDAATLARQAAQDRIPVYTVALGTPNGVLANPDPLGPPIAVPPDPQLMQEIARVSGGRSFNAQTADQLSSIYRRLGSQLSSVTRKRDVTWVFVLGGAVLLALAVGGSVRWLGRLP